MPIATPRIPPLASFVSRALALLTVGLFVAAAVPHGAWGQSSDIIISQYAEDGNIKGIELWNVSGSSIDFSNQTLVVNRYANGSNSPTQDFSKSSGTLADGAVLVVADASANSVWNGTGAEQANFFYNGDDALEVVLGGTQQDVFGTIGTDPGSSWDGNGVSTRDQNIELQSGITDGTGGFSDPSTRFNTVDEAPLDNGTSDGGEAGRADVDGFGTAPGGASGPTVQFTSNSNTVGEGDGSTTLTAEISNPDGNQVDVDVELDPGSSADASDIDNYSTQTITFPSSASDGDTQDVTVTITDDSNVEGTETATFNLTNLTNGNATIGSPSQFDLEITDNDQPPSRLIISQYVETASGTTPKGIELWNVSGSTIDFSSTNLIVNLYSNGGTSGTNQAEVTTGTLADGEVLVIGGSDLQTHMNNNAPGVRFINDSFPHNGNDALEVVLGGTQEDVFGTIGNDPGTAWTGNGVSTAGQNIQLLSGITDGSTGFTDPSTRFETVVDPAEDDQDLNGFGTAPASATPEVQFTQGSATVNEGEGSTTLAIEILNPPSGTLVDAEVAISSGGANVGNSGSFPQSIQFPTDAADGDVQTVTVDMSSDGTAVFDLQNVSGGSAAEGSPNQSTLTIEDAVGDHSGAVMITEFMPNPDAVNDTDGEYVELFNPTTSNISIDGWDIDGDAISGVTIPERGFVVLCRNSDAATNGGVLNCDDQISLSLSNGSDAVVLSNSSGTEIDRIDYDDTNWPDPAGAAVVFTGTTDNNNGNNWSTATERELGFAQDQTGDSGSPGRNGDQQNLQPSITLDSGENWYMLSAPIAGITPAELAATNLVQGINGLDFSGGDPNVYQWPGGTTGSSNFTDTTPSSTADLTGNGQGFIWYLFDTAGTSDTDTPPFTYSLPGVPRTSNVTTSGLGAGFYLLGNPYAQSYDLSSLDLSTQDFSTTVQVWDPSAGSYVDVIQSDNDDDVIAPFQGFFVERSSGTSNKTLTFAANGRRADPISIKSVEEGPARIAFRLTGRGADGEVLTHDEALTLTARPEATTTWDVYDASKLTPLSGRYATAAFHGTRDGESWLQAVASVPSPLPEGGAELPVALQMRGTQEVDALTLSWPEWQRVPSHWGIGLYDTVADTTINLRTQSSYTFRLPSAKAQSVPPPRAPMTLPSSIRAKADSDDPRFVLRLQSDPLPVELAGFDATVARDAVQLTWRTASETNNAGFHVEHRTPDAAGFADLGFVEGAGTTDAPQQYRFRTSALDPGSHTFRLRQVDVDGTTAFSDTVAVRVRMQQTATLAIGPNPVRQQATVTLRLRDEQDVDVALYDVLGRRVRSVHTGAMAAGRRHTLSLDVNGLASGLYLLRASGEQFQTTRRVTVVR